MDHKQMILLEYLLESLTNKYEEYEYSLIFKINNSSYTGDFLQIIETDSGKKRVAFQRNGIHGYKLEDHSLAHEEKDMNKFIRDRFFEMIKVNEQEKAYELLLSHPSLFFSKIIELVKDLDIDNYLDKTFEIPNTIYNLRNFNNDKEFYKFYHTLEDIQPVSIFIK